MISTTWDSLALFAIFLSLASLVQPIDAAETMQKHYERLLERSNNSPAARSYIKNPDRRRQAQEDVDVETFTSEDGKTIYKLTGNIECRLWNNCILFQNEESLHEWVCTFDDETLSEMFEDTEVVGDAITEYLDAADSGTSVLVLTEAEISDNKMSVDMEKVVGLENYGSGSGSAEGQLRTPKPKKPYRRNLAPSKGTLSTLVVRVNTLDNSPPSAVQLNSDVYGDEYCLKSQYKRCSYDQLRIDEYENGDIPGVDVATATGATGVVDINLNRNSTGVDRKVLQLEANAALRTMFGVTNNNDLQGYFDLVLFCMPPGTGSWLAYAYIGRFDSYYNDQWCTSVSAQMHEVGHNIGLDHSGEFTGSDSNQEYGDKSGMMGFSYLSDDTPVMCFNPAKNWQLGWYNDRIIEIDADSDLTFAPKSYILNGFVDYLNRSTPNATVVMKIGDFYIGYNRQLDFNAGTQEAGDLVTIQKKVGLKSKLQAKLGIGSTTTIELDFLEIKIKYVGNSQNDKDAELELSIVGDPVECQGPEDAEVVVDLLTDGYPDETSWFIVDSLGQRITEVYQAGEARALASTTVGGLCRGIEYSFVIEDTYGDGICCSYGSGNFAVKYQGEVLVTGGEFGSQLVRPFTIPLDPEPEPTASPTASPTNTPTASPTNTPTASPTNTPTSSPTVAPVPDPTPSPTSGPTSSPTNSPTSSPTNSPTSSPTNSPTSSPTKAPTSSPTSSPTEEPVDEPVDGPVDDSGWLYRGKAGKGCNWVGGQSSDRKTKIICLRRANNEPGPDVWFYCQKSCCDAGINKACS